MKLRRAVPKDAAEIAGIQADAWRRTYADLVPPDLVGAWTGYLTNGVPHAMQHGVVTVATENRRILGYVSTDKARLWGIFVRQEVWGTKVAQMLFDEAAEQCGPGLYAHTLRDNLRARRFFERQGMRAAAEINDLYFDFEVPSVIYTR